MDPPPLTNPFAEPTPSFDTALSSHTPPPTTQLLSHLLPIKLTRDNYLLWKELFLPILQTYDMLNILDGSEPCPPQFIPDPQDASLSILNPSFPHWIKKDRTCKIWINSSLSEQILPYTIGCPTSQSLWLNLERRFAATTRSHLLQLKAKLHTTKKGHLSMLEYLQHLKHTVNSLAAAGAPLDSMDFVAYILQGLPSEYDAFTTSIRVRADPVEPEELHGLLLSEEMALEQRNTLLNPSQPQAFSAQPTNHTSTRFFLTLTPPPPLGPSIPPTAPLLHLPINNNTKLAPHNPTALPNPTAISAAPTLSNHYPQPFVLLFVPPTTQTIVYFAKSATNQGTLPLLVATATITLTKATPLPLPSTLPLLHTAPSPTFQPLPPLGMLTLAPPTT